MRGALSTVWFDRSRICRDCPEHLHSIQAMCSTLGSVIGDEVSAGVPAHRIVVGMDAVEGGCCVPSHSYKYKRWSLPSENVAAHASASDITAVGRGLFA